MFKFLCRFFFVVVPAFLTHFKFYVCFLFLILGRLFLFLLFLLIISYLSLTLLSQSIVYIPSLFAVSLMTFFSVAYFMIFLNIPWVIKRVYLYSFSFFVRVFFFLLRHVGSSLSKDQTHAPFVGSTEFHHWTTRGVLVPSRITLSLTFDS